MNYPSITGYTIMSVLGKGGMGTVYLARQLSLNRNVAIKVLPIHLAESETYVARFHLEAKAAARIKHAGIVQIYDAGEENGLCYFAMEHVNGETTLDRLRRKTRLDEKSSLLICESVAVALEHAWHEASLVHRDLKPENILIDSDGTVKVVDLGLAKLRDPSSKSITISHMMIGTPYYCAPEQARGEFDIDFRSDIYSLGATLYHFLTGEPPFSETSGISAMLKNVSDYLPDPMDRNFDISEPTVWLIEKMMAKDKANRHQGWNDVLQDIDLAISGKAIASECLPEGASTILRGVKRQKYGPKFSRKKRKRTTSSLFRLFLIIAAIFTLALYALWFRMEHQRKINQAEDTNEAIDFVN